MISVPVQFLGIAEFVLGAGGRFVMLHPFGEFFLLLLVNATIAATIIIHKLAPFVVGSLLIGHESNNILGDCVDGAFKTIFGSDDIVVLDGG